MRAGTLRHRVTLQKPIRAADGYGGAAVTWEDVADVWAGIQPMSDRERFFSQQISPLATHKVSLRYSGDTEIQQSWQILYGTRKLKIVGKRNLDERNRELELFCEEEPS